jgi:hypothetical protein
VEGGPVGDGTSSQSLLLLVVQVRAWWPNLLHFLHWFGRPEYKIICAIMSSVSAPSAINGIRMYPGSLEMFFNSNVIRGPAGLLMYESAGSISSTSLILLAIMVRALVFQNCSCKLGNWTLIAWVSWASAPWELASKFEMYRENERRKSLHSTDVRRRVALAPYLSSNRISK